MIVLNVGGGGSRYLPPHFNGWEQHLLDIDEQVNPDICCDALELNDREDLADKYDAVFSSHMVEHFYQHDVHPLLKGFHHVLKPGGYAIVHVPNIRKVFEKMSEGNLDLNDAWYRNGDGIPITFHDVLYGWGPAMRGGNLYYAHKCGFTKNTLGEQFMCAGFSDIRVGEEGIDLIAMGYRNG